MSRRPCSCGTYASGISSRITPPGFEYVLAIALRHRRIPPMSPRRNTCVSVTALRPDFAYDLPRCVSLPATASTESRRDRLKIIASQVTRGKSSRDLTQLKYAPSVASSYNNITKFSRKRRDNFETLCTKIRLQPLVVRLLTYRLKKYQQ